MKGRAKETETSQWKIPSGSNMSNDVYLRAEYLITFMFFVISYLFLSFVLLCLFTYRILFLSFFCISYLLLSFFLYFSYLLSTDRSKGERVLVCTRNIWWVGEYLSLNIWLKLSITCNNVRKMSIRNKNDRNKIRIKGEDL